ncbi:MAG: DUF4278 domain-containing protein [Cyanobacteria bacterium P01_A01_bin.135]
MKLKFLGVEYVRSNASAPHGDLAGRYRGLSWQAKPTTGVQRSEVTLQFLGRSYQSEV